MLFRSAASTATFTISYQVSREKEEVVANEYSVRVTGVCGHARCGLGMAGRAAGCGSLGAGAVRGARYLHAVGRQCIQPGQRGTELGPRADAVLAEVATTVFAQPSE